MFCYKCGSKIDDGNKFCSSCGASQEVQATPVEPSQNEQMLPINEQQQFTPQEFAQPMYTQQPYAQPYMQQPYAPPYPQQPYPQPPKKSKKVLWISLGSVAAVAIIAVAAYFIFFQSFGNIAKIGRAFSNFGAEATERIDNSPLKALTMLPEIMEDGTLTANVDYSFSLFGGVFDVDIGANVKLMSNTSTREFALNAAVNESGDLNEIDLNINRESLAMRLGFIDNNFYGITYDTFRDDIRPFGRMVGLDNYTMDGLADVVDLLNNVINYEGDFFEVNKAYADAFARFTKNLSIKSTSTHIELSGEQINCTAVEVLVSKDDILDLLYDLHAALESNEDLQLQFELFNLPTSAVFGGGVSTFKQYLDEIKDSINEIERNYYGDIILTFYIGRGDRLLSMNIDADLEIDRQDIIADITLNLGESVYDTWELIISTPFDTGTVQWLYDEQSSNHSNSLIIKADSDYQVITLSSEWNKDNGRFKLAFNDGSGWVEGSITGFFNHDEKSFSLALDDFFANEPSQSLSVDIKAQSGSQFRDVSFINIDQWGESLIDMVSDLLFGLIF